MVGRGNVVFRRSARLWTPYALEASDGAWHNLCVAAVVAGGYLPMILTAAVT